MFDDSFEWILPQDDVQIANESSCFEIDAAEESLRMQTLKLPENSMQKKH